MELKLWIYDRRKHIKKYMSKTRTNKAGKLFRTGAVVLTSYTKKAFINFQQ